MRSLSEWNLEPIISPMGNGLGLVNSENEWHGVLGGESYIMLSGFRVLALGNNARPGLSVFSEEH